MTGTVQGNILAIIFFIFFQICGIIFSFCLLKKEEFNLRLLAGSVFGSLLLHWVPTLSSLFLGFNTASHVTAALVVGVTAAFVSMKCRLKTLLTDFKAKIQLSKPGAEHILLLSVFAVFAALVTGSFEFRDGIMYSGQATFGDTSMHLSFITSIAQQGVFPPDYSILPGTKLSYPFLSDSISSSLYIWGAGLKLSYCLPMYFAGLQVMGGLWLLMRNWLCDRHKTILAWLLFFLNGGFGLIYFISGLADDPTNFTRIFTAFYETPTNLVGENIRWVNVIVDMLLPQRATLFGWAVLILAVQFLYRGVWHKENDKFVITALLAGALPMIHTHSFVALALISAAWLVMDISEKVGFGARFPWVKLSFAASFILMQLLQLTCKDREADIYLFVLASYVVVFAVLLFSLLVASVLKGFGKDIVSTWGIYLAVTLVFALPQLFTWTFRQASGEGFVRAYFNWANIDDNYIWFYVKNIGLAFIMFVPGLAAASKRMTALVSPVLLIWVMSELAVFQPNVYDNNKFLYVAYIFLCVVSADYMTELYRKIRTVKASGVLAFAAVFICIISAVLTIGREFVAEYELVGRDQYMTAEYISEHTEPGDTFLTDQRHNNAVAALTGRNIVCGSPSYLFFHGLDYTAAAEDQKKMFEDPRNSIQLFEKYSVDYIMISSYERSSYNVDEFAIAAMFPCVYSCGDTALYAVN